MVFNKNEQVNITLVNHDGLRCGVYQFGKNIASMLEYDSRISSHYIACNGIEAFEAELSKLPTEVLIVNYHPETMSWMSAAVLEKVDAVKFVVLHEFNNRLSDSIEMDGFDFHLCADPTLVRYNARVIPVPRFFPVVHTPSLPAFDIPTFGSFGFATGGKGFDIICSRVAAEFERARVRINIPRHDSPRMVSDSQRQHLIEQCRNAAAGTGVELEITDHFFDNADLLKFCSENHLNILAYTDMGDRGISSCADVLLACGRPFLVSDSPMFRHMHQYQPTVRLSQTSLRAAMEVDPGHYRLARKEIEPANAARQWVDALLGAVERKAVVDSVPDRRGMNKILDDVSRTAYAPVVVEMWQVVPDIMERKIPEANVQQAFVLDTVRRLASLYTSPRILAVGAFEDTACEVLKHQGYRMTAIDPTINISLNDFYLLDSTALNSFDIVISTSVLEHVADHMLFLRQCADLLAPGGCLVLTVDFKEGYRPGDPMPSVDHRLYTSQMIRSEIMPELPDCRLFDKGNWEEAVPDFTFEGIDYNFASIVIEKLVNTRLYVNPEQFDPAAATAWRRYAAHAAQAGSRSQDIVGAFGEAKAVHFLEPEEVARLVAAGREVPDYASRIDALERDLAASASLVEAGRKGIEKISADLADREARIENVNERLTRYRFFLSGFFGLLFGKAPRV